MTDARAAAVFLRPATRALLAQVAEPRTAAEAAAGCGLPLNLAWYHLKRLVELGLVREAGARPRRGRAARQYQACAAAFYVPAELAARSLGDQLAEELRDLLAQSDIHRQGELFWIDGNGRMRARKVPEGSACPSTDAFESWSEVRVRPADVPRLASELRELVACYAARAGEGSAYLFHAALARRR